MSKKSEKSKDKFKKLMKYSAICCTVGFGVLLFTTAMKTYRDNQTEKLRLSSDRNTYFEKAYKENRVNASDEFFSEMFMSRENWYAISEERVEQLSTKIKSIETEIDMSIGLFNALTYSEFECQCNFDEDMSAYSEFLGKVNSELWSADDNKDISVRLFSKNGDQIVLYWFNGEKYMDYYFSNGELLRKWESVRNSNELSEFKSIKYNELVLTEEKVKECLEKHGTVIPYVADELIEAYNESEPIKIVFSSDECLGYDFLPEGKRDALMDSNYSGDLYGEDVANNETQGSEVTEIGSGLESGLDDSDDKENINVVPLSELDLNTKEIQYLTPEDYSEYTAIVEENDLNYNPNILVAQGQMYEGEMELESKSWVCLLGNPRLFADISAITKGVKSANISYQLMYYLYQCDTTSIDLGSNVDVIIDNYM